MANPDIINEILAQKAVAALSAKIAPLTVFSTVFATEPASLYDTAKVLVFSAGDDAADFSHETGYSAADCAAMNVVPVSYAYRPFAAKTMDDVFFEKLRANSDGYVKLFATLSQQLVKDCRKKVHAKLAAAGTKIASFSATADSAAKFTFADFTAALAAYVEGDRDLDDATVTLSMAAYTALMNDPAVSKSMTTAAQDAVVGGKIATLGGVRVECDPLLKDKIGLVSKPSLVALASAPTPAPSAATENLLVVSEPQTGFTFTFKTVRDDDHATATPAAEAFFGCEVVQPAAGMWIVPAATEDAAA